MRKQRPVRRQPAGGVVHYKESCN